MRALISILIISAVTTTVFAQKTSQATMKVSVSVVKGSSVEASHLQLLNYIKDGKADLGFLKLRGIDEESVLVSSNSSVELTNQKGEKAIMNITSRRERVTKSDNSIRFEGTSNVPLTNDTIYTGKLSTTVEYL